VNLDQAKQNIKAQYEQRIFTAVALLSQKAKKSGGA
jgi:hypothetical protein